MRGEGEIERDAARLGAARRPVRVDDVAPMLADTADAPFSSPDWVFELKYDGYRFMAGRIGEDVRLLTRNGRDAAAAFPEVADALRSLGCARFIADGEIVVHDEAGLPSFQRLQRRAGLTRPVDVRRATVELPATMYLFDLVSIGDHDVRDVPLVARKALLRRLVPGAGALRYADHVEADGEALYAQVRRLGLEGIVAKKAQSRYRSGRSAEWLKIRAHRRDDFVVVGFTQPKGARGGFGALHLAAYDGSTLVYCGQVGSGFTQRQLDETYAALQRSVLPAAPCAGAPAGKGHTWVAPSRVADVRYTEWTDEGLLRQPVFLGFRDDQTPAECVRPAAGRGAPQFEPEPAPPVAPAAPVAASDRRVAFRNLDKPYWPEDGYTKGDMIAYYRSVSPWLLPYLRDRPIVVTRYPDGIHGKSFYQKDAPGFAPKWLRRERVWSEASDRELSYFVCDDEASLLHVANSGAILLHVWSSRVGTLARPDWCSLDLDPKGAPFGDVVEVACAVRALSREIGVPSFVKTSGSSGLHVLVPLGCQFTHEQARVLGELLARVVVGRLPRIATIERVVDQREGKVYVDFLQNGQGKLLVAPFSLRPIPGAPVSTPLSWDEVVPGLDIRTHTIATVPGRLRERGDPLRDVLTLKPDLLAALEKLAALM